MNKIKYLELAQQRAIEELKHNGVASAYQSLLRDLSCHPAMANSVMVKIFKNLFLAGKLSSQVRMKRFIKGFRFRDNS